MYTRPTQIENSYLARNRSMRPQQRRGIPVRLAIVPLAACLGCFSIDGPEPLPYFPPFALGEYVLLSASGVQYPIDFGAPMETPEGLCSFAYDSGHLKLSGNWRRTTHYSRARCQDVLTSRVSFSDTPIFRWTATGLVEKKVNWGACYSPFPCAPFNYPEYVIVVRGDTLDRFPPGDSVTSLQRWQRRSP